jgi:hypothetical protein
MTRTLTVCLLVLTGSGLFVACEEPPPLRLTSRQRERVDSLYVDAVKGLNQEMDSLCSLRYETELPLMVDSLVQVRRSEEARLRKKYQRK